MRASPFVKFLMAKASSAYSQSSPRLLKRLKLSAKVKFAALSFIIFVIAVVSQLVSSSAQQAAALLQLVKKAKPERRKTRKPRLLSSRFQNPLFEAGFLLGACWLLTNITNNYLASRARLTYIALDECGAKYQDKAAQADAGYSRRDGGNGVCSRAAQ